MVIGDCNCVLKGEERSRRDGVSSRFIRWVEQCGLIDLGYSGNSVTWNYGTCMGTRRAARLDRCMYDDVWRWLFPTADI